MFEVSMGLSGPPPATCRRLQLNAQGKQKNAAQRFAFCVRCLSVPLSWIDLRKRGWMWQVACTVT